LHCWELMVQWYFRKEKETFYWKKISFKDNNCYKIQNCSINESFWLEDQQKYPKKSFWLTMVTGKTEANWKSMTEYFILAKTNERITTAK
jgi:hypothetical protein